MSNIAQGSQRPPARSASEALYPGLWTGLAAFWDPAVGGRGNLPDWSGNRKDGVLVNMETADWNSGRRGLALDFGGTDEYVDTALVWNYSGPVTVSFWNFVPTAVDSAAWGGSLPDAASNTDRFMSHAPWGNGTLYWDYGDLNTDGRISVSYTAYLGLWTHVLLYSDGIGGTSKSIRFNGQTVATSGTSDGPNGPFDFDIGRISTSTPVQYHTGRIGHLGIWTRPLREAEIQFLASGGSPLQRRRIFRGASTMLQSITVTAGIASAQAFGTLIIAGPITITAGISSGEAFGVATVSLDAGPQNITVTAGIASALAFGAIVVAGPITITAGIASAEAFGATVVAGPITITAGIASAEAFGIAMVAFDTGAQSISATGLPSAEVFGSAKVRTWLSVGHRFLYTAGHWRTTEFALEVFWKATAGTVYAGLRNETDGVDLLELLSTNSSTYTRSRSTNLLPQLVDGKEYRVLFGHGGTDAGEWKYASLISE
jgi:hypothetical protein